MPMKELGKSGEDAGDMPQISCRSQFSSFSPCKVSGSGCGSHEDVTNLSPHYSWLPNYSSLLERSLYDNSSLMDMKKPWKHDSPTSNSSHETLFSQPAMELVKEITALEHEVLHMERYLLSLYRATFNRYLVTSFDKDQAREFPSMCQTGPSVEKPRNQGKDKSKSMSCLELSAPSNSGNNRTETCTLDDIEKRREFELQFCNTSRPDLADSEDRKVPSTGNGKVHSTGNPSTDSSRPSSRHRSLADHLGSSLIDCVSETPCKLSEEIIRCICSIYGKLSDSPMPQIDLLASPTSSLSSSSTFSPQDTYDAWSPKYHYEAATSPYRSDVPKGKQGPYRGMLELLKICIDGDKFNYAATMLQHFKTLIRRLEKVDPIKMEHGEKLAFWINVHNALVMHAFLAYGLHQNYMKSTSSIMKAAYNVGGLSINAYEIQRSIFECQPHRPEPRLLTLFSQSQKIMKGNGKHAYALDKREPLVHFALCMGAYSDPAVRIYTSKNVLKELEIAKDEFIQANVSMHKETKIILPKILQYYAKDASMDLSTMLEIVHDCMPEIPQKIIQRFIRGRPEKCVGWLPYKSNFRYIIHRDLAKD
uniref:Ferrochelatase n=1 Tax=Anthurium amnicola TaxID=1678845 RepID=A0A1D1YT63_9ARAE